MMATTQWQDQMSTMNGNNSEAESTGREAGIIEKLLHSYGFIRCCDRQARLFFHYSQFSGNVEHLKIGDPVDFEMSYDKKSGKPVATSVSKICSDPNLGTGENLVSGIVTAELKPGICEGRVAYENCGECYFLAYFAADLVNPMEELRQGQNVSFFITSDSAGNLQAKQVRSQVVENGHQNGHQNGIVKELSPLKARRSQLETPTAQINGLPMNNKTLQGVVCSLKDSFGFIERSDIVKEIFFHQSECMVFDKLSLGDDVSFEIQSRNNREVAVNVQRLPAGSVVFEDIDDVVMKGSISRTLSQSDEPLGGKISYTSSNQSMEVPFGERDLTPNFFTIQNGDPVNFQLATDRRDGLLRATNITFAMNDNSAFQNETRKYGTVVTIRDQYGFIACDDGEIYFRLSEILDNDELEVDHNVEFTMVQDPHSNSTRNMAIRIIRNKKPKAKKANPKYTNKGYIVALKDSFGFIEAESRIQDVFFHFSVFDGNANQLSIGQEVEYAVTMKGQKLSAEAVRVVKDGTIAAIQLESDETHTGHIERTLRCFNPEQEQYCGLVRKILPVSENGDESVNMDGEAYEFSVMSLAKKGEMLHKGDLVEFQVCVQPSMLAVNVRPIREKKQATVEAVKGQYGFLNYELEGGKKLFFHMTQVKGPSAVAQGDKVEFFIVRHQRTSKYSACNITKMNDCVASPRPASLISRLRAVSVADDLPKVVAIRQPKGPDGTKGFARFNFIQQTAT